MLDWALAVRWQYEQALRQAEELGEDERRERYKSLLRQTGLLTLQYAHKQHSCQALAKRLLRHLGELYRFVLHPEAPANNNLPERVLRPVVV